MKKSASAFLLGILAASAASAQLLGVGVGVGVGLSADTALSSVVQGAAQVVAPVHAEAHLRSRAALHPAAGAQMHPSDHGALRGEVRSWGAAAPAARARSTPDAQPDDQRARRGDAAVDLGARGEAHWHGAGQGGGAIDAGTQLRAQGAVRVPQVRLDVQSGARVDAGTWVR